MRQGDGILPVKLADTDGGLGLDQPALRTAGSRTSASATATRFITLAAIRTNSAAACERSSLPATRWVAWASSAPTLAHTQAT